jgi:hypothetical protein
MLRRVVSLKLTDVSEVLTASIIRVMEALHGATSQKSHLYTRHRENLKSHEVAHGYFKILSHHWPGGTEENHSKPQSVYQVSGTKFESPEYKAGVIITIPVH